MPKMVTLENMSVKQMQVETCSTKHARNWKNAHRRKDSNSYCSPTATANSPSNTKKCMNNILDHLLPTVAVSFAVESEENNLCQQLTDPKAGKVLGAGHRSSCPMLFHPQTTSKTLEFLHLQFVLQTCESTCTGIQAISTSTYDVTISWWTILTMGVIRIMHTWVILEFHQKLFYRLTEQIIVSSKPFLQEMFTFCQVTEFVDISNWNRLFNFSINCALYDAAEQLCTVM